MLMVSFQLAGTTYAVAAERVIEIIRPQPLTPVPLAPDVVAGLLNLRGQIVVAFDLARRLGVVATCTMNVLVRTAAGPASLLVERIGDIIDVDPATFAPAPDTLPEHVRGVVVGSYPLSDRLLLVLDADRAAHCQDDGDVS